MKLILLGSTGLVGGHVLKLALQDKDISEVMAITRTPLKAHPKLQNVLADFDSLPEEHKLWQGDAVICTLGTTIKKAKTKEAFKKIDLEYPLKGARLAFNAGTKKYILNSAKGADKSSSFFYNQVKGELEEKLIHMNFPSLIIVRPGLIGGQRNEKRPLEEIAKLLYKVLNPLLPKSLQINYANKIAKKLIHEAKEDSSAFKIIESHELV